MSPGLMWAPQLTKLLHHFNMFQLFPMYLLFMVNHLIFQFNIINDPSLAFYKGNFFVKLNADMKQVFISLQPTTSFFFFWPTPQISPAYFLAAFFGTFKKDAGLYLESLVNKKNLMDLWALDFQTDGKGSENWRVHLVCLGNSGVYF